MFNNTTSYYIKTHRIIFCAFLYAIYTIKILLEYILTSVLFMLLLAFISANTDHVTVKRDSL
ncbi:hypothetical protein GCM10028778_24160 [Barrientosiimonas marina]